MPTQGNTTTTAGVAREALARIERAAVLSQILSCEPRLLPTLQPALEQQLGRASSPADYDRNRVYVALKRACRHLVGYEAENTVLRTHRHWEVFVSALFDALPPDRGGTGMEDGEAEESAEQESDW